MFVVLKRLRVDTEMVRFPAGGEPRPILRRPHRPPDREAIVYSEAVPKITEGLRKPAGSKLRSSETAIERDSYSSFRLAAILAPNDLSHIRS